MRVEVQADVSMFACYHIRCKKSQNQSHAIVIKCPNRDTIHRSFAEQYSFRFPESTLLVHITPSSLVATVLTVALRLVKLLVKSLSPPLNSEAKQDRAKAAEQNESTSESVERLLAGREEVRGEPVRGLADTIRNGDQSCFLAARCRDQGRLPGELQVETVVGARNQQACAEVASADVGSGDHDRDADC